MADCLEIRTFLIVLSTQFISDRVKGQECPAIFFNDVGCGLIGPRVCVYVTLFVCVAFGFN